MEWRTITRISVFSMFIFVLGIQLVKSWGSSDQVRLEDVQVLTLYSGKMTNARRSSPIPQLKCTGGSAGCHSFVPQVVQCYNRGSDGIDVQWECTTDMDNAYRFGRIEVSCEGYDYPEDPYILKGSCGLEYTIDLTKEGHQQQKQHNYYGDNSHGNEGGYYHAQKKRSSSWFGDLIMWVVIGVIVFAIYKSCTNTRHATEDRYPSDGYPPGSGSRWGGGGGGGGGGSPPPPGFRSDYMPDAGGCSANAGAGTSAGSGAAAGGGGFWTGAATGGLLGYMFGNRNRGYGTGYGSGYGFGSGYRSGYTRPSGGFGTFTGGGGHRSSSSGTRTASGFGGTSRR